MGNEDPTTYTYTHENWLASVTLPDDSTTSYTYCALGKRVMKVDGSGTVMYRPDGNNTSVEQDGSGNTLVAYTYNPYGLVGNIISNRKSGTDSYYHYDGIGNVGNLTNGSETLTTSYAYDAFGNILSGSSSYNTVGFQTKPWEGDVGLYYSRARYYDPQVGRFTSSDPILRLMWGSDCSGKNKPMFATPGMIYDQGRLNPYTYANNNPVRFTDPKGLFHTAADCDADYDDCIAGCKKYSSKVQRAICYSGCAVTYAGCLATANETLAVAGVAIAVGVAVSVAGPVGVVCLGAI